MTSHKRQPALIYAKPAPPAPRPAPIPRPTNGFKSFDDLAAAVLIRRK